jgi:tRNA modification GTPase
MSYDPDATICAIATAPGGAARGMVRISGRDALTIVARFFRTEDGAPITWPTCAAVVAGNMRLALSEEPLSEAIERQAPGIPRDEVILPCDLFVWPNQRSYTREPVVEVHTIGSTPILEALLAAVCRAGARLADPGEFTLRAFLAGRIDLTQAEAVLGIIDAGGRDELDSALAQLAGGLAQPLHTARDALLQLLAELEAGLDFVDEDIEFVSRPEVLARLDAASRLLSEIGTQMVSRQTTSAAYRVALVGPPNAGKSSLFNALIERYGTGRASDQSFPPAALVSPLSGTTRDYLTAVISLGEVRCELVDTAGMEPRERAELSGIAPPHRRGANSDIDQAARARVAEQGDRATVRVLCLDATCISSKGAIVEDLQSFSPYYDILVFTKADLLTPPIPSIDRGRALPTVLTSSRTGDGLEKLSKALCGVLASAETHVGCAVTSTADRCRESIRRAGEALKSARDLAQHDRGSELIAAEIRAALDELGKVVGAIYTEDLLDRIFSTFCIGK